MVAGIFHEGSGLGDQLFRYITVRTLAEEKGYEWGMFGSDSFKGADFMRLEKGNALLHGLLLGHLPIWKERETKENNIDIRSYDPEINFVEDNTVIDGSFEDSKYWGHNLSKIGQWLAVEPLVVPDDTCIIGFRGGEYSAISALFLPKSFYFKGVEMMKAKDVTKFEVHTDDPELARRFFPDFKIVENAPISHSKHMNMGYNWRSARYAKYAIIPNSAFFIIPRLLQHHANPDAVTIAPRYWARYNTKTWARPSCFYKPFTYIHEEDAY